MKNYLVIGGNSGIGFAVGSALINAGHTVHQWSRSEGELSELGAIHTLYRIGEGCPTLETHLDGVVYCPGSIRLKPFHRIGTEEFQEDFEINALGAVEVLQAAFPALKQSTHPSVVLFSTVAVSTGLSFHASIAMAKAAVEGLTKSLAAEWAPKIRVNAVAPSLTDTPLASSLLSSDARKEAAASRHPLKKIGDPEQTAKLVQFLLGEDASFITGQVISVDGGLGALRV